MSIDTLEEETIAIMTQNAAEIIFEEIKIQKNQSIEEAICRILGSMIKEGNLAEVKKLGFYANARDEYNRTALHYATLVSDIDIVKHLVEKENVNISAKDARLCTPLHTAVRKGDLDIVKFLVQKGADMYVKDNNNDTPLQIAIELEQAEIIKYLRIAELKLRTWYSSSDL